MVLKYPQKAQLSLGCIKWASHDPMVLIFHIIFKITLQNVHDPRAGLEVKFLV